jgi:hypothetical protein
LLNDWGFIVFNKSPVVGSFNAKHPSSQLTLFKTLNLPIFDLILQIYYNTFSF